MQAFPLLKRRSDQGGVFLGSLPNSNAKSIRTAVKIGAGASTVRQYLKAGLVDSIHFARAPAVLGQGEALFTGVDLAALGFSVTEHKATEHATHFMLEKNAGPNNEERGGRVGPWRKYKRPGSIMRLRIFRV
jgi:hypothetical protein